MSEERPFKNYFMLTTNEIVSQSLRQYFQLYDINLSLIIFNSFGTHQAFIAEYNRIVKDLEAKIDNVSNNVVFIDYSSSTFTSVDQLNPLMSGDSQELPQFISMLILTFPEIHWIFVLDIKAAKEKNDQFLNNFHSYNINCLNLLIKRTLEFSNLNLINIFDPCNLRNRIKKNICKSEKGLPRRGLCAAAIDEEIFYAIMNAYTAYRFGYRAWVVSTFGMMEYVFKMYDLRSANDKTQEQALIIEFKTECEWDRSRNIVLIVSVTIDTTTEWTVSGINDEGEFKTVPIDNNDKLAKELKKGESHRNKIIELATSYLGHTLYKNKKCDIKFVFEDLYLNFPDKDEDIHLSKLKRRDGEFSRLKCVDERILITVGHKNTDNARSIWLCNLQYLKSNFSNRYKILYKPLAGIFDLWKKAGKWKPYSNIPELAKDFYWPPEKNSTREDENDRHSAPGRLLLISEKLIERSKRVLKCADSVSDAIHAATLALEAKELLACKTPAMSMEALSLQHQAEVEAECMFHGVEYNLDVKSRIKDIKKEVTAISKWFHHSSKKRSQLNAEISILNTLAQRYRKYSQFDEENICLHENRKLTNTLWTIRNPCNPLRLLGWLFRYYINFLLKSLTRFAIVILLWVFLFGVILWCKANGQPNVDVEFIDSVIVSAKTFLAFQPPGLEFWIPYQAPKIGHISTPIRLVWFIAPAILGFVHLGVFISHLTMILMRKSGGE